MKTKNVFNYIPDENGKKNVITNVITICISIMYIAFSQFLMTIQNVKK